jgi:uncharacterized protein (DUF2062 family)
MAASSPEAIAAQLAALETLKHDVLSPLVIGSFLSSCATGLVLFLAAQYAPFSTPSSSQS